MSEKSMALSTKALVDDALPRWQAHLQRLQARRDRLQNELEEANKAIAQHIGHRQSWLQYSAHLIEVAKRWT